MHGDHDRSTDPPSARGRGRRGRRAGLDRRPGQVQVEAAELRDPVPDRLHHVALSDLASLVHLERPAAEEPAGALVLFHGRGADERDLFPLLEALDPERRLLGLTPRGPLSLPPGGAHWYVLGQLGYPERESFLSTYSMAGGWLDALAEETGISAAQTILGGFSQGAVMSYALGLGATRPRPAAILALSGFVPTVEGFELDLDRPLPPVAIGHGVQDPIIGVEWSRRARRALEERGAEPLYRESPLPHTIDPTFVPDLVSWLHSVV
ncbi:MAG: phospholipase [Candidatus Rokuibacteriota bacterium]|nr:MAG: phospholipase [Candidatus Rokubacteria bacterium]